MITQAVELVGAGVDADRDADVVHLLRAEQLAGLDLPCVENLAAQRHDGLRLAIASLFRRAARRIALDEEELREIRLLARAIGELTGQRRSRDDALAHDLLRSLEALLSRRDRILRDLVARFRMLVEPEREHVLGDTADEARALA